MTDSNGNGKPGNSELDNLISFPEGGRGELPPESSTAEPQVPSAESNFNLIEENARVLAKATAAFCEPLIEKGIYWGIIETLSNTWLQYLLELVRASQPSVPPTE